MLLVEADPCSVAAISNTPAPDSTPFSPDAYLRQVLSCRSCTDMRWTTAERQRIHLRAELLHPAALILVLSATNAILPCVACQVLAFVSAFLLQHEQNSLAAYAVLDNSRRAASSVPHTRVLCCNMHGSVAASLCLDACVLTE